MADPATDPKLPEASTRTQVFTLLGKVLDSAVDPKTLVILCGTFLGWVYMLPSERRHEAKVMDFLSILMGGDGPWVLTTLVLGMVLTLSWALGGLVIFVQHRRLQAVDAEQAALRRQEDPQRLSSKDTSGLAAYAKSSKATSTAKVKR